MTKKRPNSIIWFERLFFTSLVVSYIDLFVHRDTYFSDEEMSDDMGLVFGLTISVALIIGFGIQILLWFFTAHRASNWARWIYVVLCVLTLGGVVGFIVEYTASELAFLAITQVLAIGSVICLFTPEARFWFQSNGLIAHGNGHDLTDIFK
ncbi:MAG: hypothetical protein ABJN65_02655 [Parasphingorhabdus sp.]